MGRGCISSKHFRISCAAYPLIGETAIRFRRSPYLKSLSFKSLNIAHIAPTSGPILFCFRLALWGC